MPQVQGWRWTVMTSWDHPCIEASTEAPFFDSETTRLLVTFMFGLLSLKSPESVSVNLCKSREGD